MSIPSKIRNRVLGVTVLLAAALTFTWYNKTYRPVAEEVASIEAQVVEQLRQNKAAATTDLAVGAERADQAIRASREEAAELATLVPPSSPGALEARPFVDVLTRAAASHGVRVRHTQPIATATEGQFEVGGIRVQVSGRYHDVAALMTDVLSQPRLTQIRGVTVGVLPDSLMQAAIGQPMDGSAFGMVADSDASFSPPQGEPPFTVWANFSLHWFSLVAAAAPAEATAPDAGASEGEAIPVPIEGI